MLLANDINSMVNSQQKWKKRKLAVDGLHSIIRAKLSMIILLKNNTTALEEFRKFYGKKHNLILWLKMINLFIIQIRLLLYFVFNNDNNC